MAYQFKVLEQNEQDDIIVSFLLTQERDKYCHQLNLNRYDEILKTLSDGKWKKKITMLRIESAERLAEVDSIIAATERQLPPDKRFQAAKSRLKQKNG